MTPLAQSLTRLLTLPVKERADLMDVEGMINRIPESIGFDLSGVFDFHKTLSESMLKHRCIQTNLCFLPAPLTFIDMGYMLDVPQRDRYPSRTGFLLSEVSPSVDVGKAEVADVYSLDDHTIYPLGIILLGKKARIYGAPDSPPVAMAEYDRRNSKKDEIYHERVQSRVYAALALINTPRIIGRKQHMPHAGLQRALARSKGMAGKFPLHAWTEISLKIGLPKHAGDRVHEAMLSGGKCLHFCRAHLRIQHGQIVFVQSHWRGDPSLGIKQTRYRLDPPDRMAA